MTKTAKNTGTKRTKMTKADKAKLVEDTKLAKIAKKAEGKKVKPTRGPKATQTYTGAAIAATKVYNRKMVEFRNCNAECWMLINDIDQTVTYANTYNGCLKASYDPKTYTYKLVEKVVGKKLDNMVEIEVTEWPTWIVNAAGKAKKSK